MFVWDFRARTNPARHGCCTHASLPAFLGLPFTDPPSCQNKQISKEALLAHSKRFQKAMEKNNVGIKLTKLPEVKEKALGRGMVVAEEAPPCGTFVWCYAFLGFVPASLLVCWNSACRNEFEVCSHSWHWLKH